MNHVICIINAAPRSVNAA